MGDHSLRSPVVISPRELLARAQYLSKSDQKRLTEAFHFSDAAHLGQTRQSGEPYITHPLAVAEVCTDWQLDADALMAALLHDTVEDCGVTRQEIAEKFGTTVSALVDGLTKLDKIEFKNREHAQAENFRKMLLAMSDDVRVILIKLADRLHNMRTLGVVSAEKRQRIARETLDIYAPIAHRLGLNEVFRDFEDLCFAGLYPDRFRILSQALHAARGNRREIVSRLENTIREHLPKFHIKAQVTGREKSVFSIHQKMKEKRLSFAEVLDIYGFRVLVDSPSDCYLALGALHALFKPAPGKFKDYIALPKSNGYQSLHTVVVGPQGTPLEFQIRTHQMHQVAEAGVAAHWLYKESDHASASPLQRKAHEWMKSLLSVQTKDPGDFLEHVKIDLFPDVVYLFTPKGEIKELPRGATPIDFAYMVHTDIGNRCVAALVNGQAKPLDTELRNGDVVRIETRPEATPHPGWLGFVRTAKARAEIRHNLKTNTQERAIGFGRRLLDNALRAIGSTGVEDEQLNWTGLFHETTANDKNGVYESIGLGLTLAHVAARRLLPADSSSAVAGFAGSLQEEASLQTSGKTRQLSETARQALQLSEQHLTHQAVGITINGAEGTAVQYAHCCYPIAGDNAVGYMRGGTGLQIHRASCPTARRQQDKDPSRWAEISWGDPLYRDFETHLDIEVSDSPGVLAKVASAISASGANIVDISIEQHGTGFARLRVAIEVKHRQHLADVLRRVRRNAVVTKASRITRAKAGDLLAARSAARNRHSV
ncbi:MAG: RelA/SpoT family protein [Burkholderiaceae bacterium]